MLDRQGAVLFEEGDDRAGERPEVLRGELRQILIESLAEGAIRWGCKLSAVLPLGDGRHELAFEDGSTVTSQLSPRSGPRSELTRRASLAQCRRRSPRSMLKARIESAASAFTALRTR